MIQPPPIRILGPHPAENLKWGSSAMDILIALYAAVRRLDEAIALFEYATEQAFLYHERRVQARTRELTSANLQMPAEQFEQQPMAMRWASIAQDAAFMAVGDFRKRLFDLRTLEENEKIPSRAEDKLAAKKALEKFDLQFPNTRNGRNATAHRSDNFMKPNKHAHKKELNNGFISKSTGSRLLMSGSYNGVAYATIQGKVQELPLERETYEAVATIYNEVIVGSTPSVWSPQTGE